MEMEKEKEKAWYCYCLQSDTKTTYIGSTIDPDRRLRQHNKELVGGAKATARGTGWKRLCYVAGFPTSTSCLQFEWKWKHLSKRKTGTPLERRLLALEELLNSEQSTSKSELFSTFDGPLCLIIEDSACESLKAKEFRYCIVE